MRIFKNRYYNALIESHSIYILFDLVLILITFFIIYFSFQKSIENDKKIAVLDQEIRTLTEKQNNFFAIKNTHIDFDKAIKIFNQLVPEEEDYFSILYALEKISQKTNFKITSYTVNLVNNQSNTLKLTVTGIGDVNTFFKFLKEYNFGGGRLITSDNLSLNSSEQSGFKINLTFYTKKISSEESFPPIDQQEFSKKINELLAKTEFLLKESSATAVIDTNYPRKTNPFSFE